MAKKEKTPLDKQNWSASFNIIGEAKVSDFTFKIDEHSQKSDWIYNQMNLNINCGEKYGNVSVQLMGGYASERDNVIYAPTKNEDGTFDWKNMYTIDWDDRFDENILEDIPSTSFTRVGLEKTDKDKTFYKDFLTTYDAIAYIQEHLEDGMVVNVRGNLKYQMYNDSVTCNKEVTSIVLSKAEPENYRATFTQTMLLDQDSCTKDNLDKDKSVLYVDAYVLEKFREFNGRDLTDNGKIKSGQFVPLRKRFEFEVDLTTDAGKKKVQSVLSSDKMFKIKKNTVAQVTFEGEFIESGAAVTATLDDIPDDIKELMDMGIYTEEEALARCSTNGSKERRMILTKPYIKMVGDDDDKHPVIQRTDEKYSADDLLLECLVAKEEDEDIEADDADIDAEETVDDVETSDDAASDDDWLSMLD